MEIYAVGNQKERWRYEFHSQFLAYLLRVENRLITLIAEDTSNVCLSNR